MAQATATAGDGAVSSSAETTRVTSALLACGIFAGPLFVVVAVVQGQTRDGFDFTRHAISLLSDGDLGWIQITNFLFCGLLAIACATGMRRVLRGGPAGTWGPLLLGVFGVGTMVSAVFRADPTDGFPPGTPAGRVTAMSWHGSLHMAFSGMSFLALVAACFVLARRFTSQRQRGWAAYSRITGVIFLAGFASAPASVLAFFAGVIVGWAWIAVMSAWLTLGRAPASCTRRAGGS
jgi:hypothetical protein